MNKTVVYWCSRAIRVHENPALQHAYELALKDQAQLEVRFYALKSFPYANARNMHFLLSGLKEMAESLFELNIELKVELNDVTSAFSKDIDNIHSIITEHHSLTPMRIKHAEVNQLCSNKNVPFVRINTSLVVPVQIASDKLEYAARTFRPKILKKYQAFLSPQDDLKPYPYNSNTQLSFDQNAFEAIYAYYQTIAPFPTKFIPGERAARETLETFIQDGLNRYHLRNEITANANSRLSIYLHFGMLSPREMVRRVLESQNPNSEAFIEEAMVRRELAENYCYYQKNYTSLEGAWNWARQSLLKHESDPREYIYSYEELEASQTHDPLWNECQRYVREEGYLHGYLRMYWAKRVLTWTHTAQEAIDILIKLNDTYFLDGRDPNGYTGIMWSIAGVHDRAWFEQNIFGLVRIMGAKGTLTKSKLKL